MSRHHDTTPAGRGGDQLDETVAADSDPRVDALLRAITDRLTEPPDDVTARRHLAAMRQARRSPPRWRRVVAPALVAAVGLVLLTTGFAFAGVLPDPAQRFAAEAAERLGITLPRPDPNSGAVELGFDHAPSHAEPAPGEGRERREAGLDRARERSGRDLPAALGTPSIGSRPDDALDRTPSRVPDVPDEPRQDRSGDRDASVRPDEPGPPGHAPGTGSGAGGGSGSGGGGSGGGDTATPEAQGPVSDGPSEAPLPGAPASDGRASDQPDGPSGPSPAQPDDRSDPAGRP